MNTRMVAISLALALAAPAFAQDNNTPTAPTMPPAASMPQSSQSSPPAADTMPPASQTNNSAAQAGARKAMRKHRQSGSATRYTGDREHRYPAVDHGHVAGDPPIIDHSADKMIVTPTSSTVTATPTP